MILTIKEIKQKTGTGKRGAWTNWIATFTNGQNASTFDPNIGAPLVAGQTRDFTLEQNGEYWNIKGFGDLLDPSAAVPTSPGSANVPDAVWEAKDRRMAMESAAKSASIFMQAWSIASIDNVTPANFRSVYLMLYQDIIDAGEDKIKTTTPPSQNRTTSVEKPIEPPPVDNPTDDTHSAKEAPRTPDDWKAAFEGASTINELQVQWNEMQKALQPTGAQKAALQALYKKHKDRIEADALPF